MLKGDSFKPRRKYLTDIKQFRIIPSRYPPIDLFETLVEPDELEVLFEIESMTNDRLRDEVGEIELIPAADRITGPGASPVMAAFTHIGHPSRFSDGSYGVYYAGLSVETAILETRFHRERFLAMTNEAPCELEMRCYVGTIKSSFHDIRGKAYEAFKSPNIASYPVCQSFAAYMRAKKSSGLYYKSVRDPNGECIAAFKPTAVSPAIQGKHYLYRWDGKEIANVLEVKSIL